MNKEQIEQLAALSNLTLTEDETKNLISGFDSILNFVSQAADTKIKVAEDYEEAITLDDLRADEVHESLSIDEVLLNAPKKRNNCFVVPQVVE